MSAFPISPAVSALRDKRDVLQIEAQELLYTTSMASDWVRRMEPDRIYKTKQIEAKRMQWMKVDEVRDLRAVLVAAGLPLLAAKLDTLVLVVEPASDVDDTVFTTPERTLVVQTADDRFDAEYLALAGETDLPSYILVLRNHIQSILGIIK